MSKDKMIHLFFRCDDDFYDKLLEISDYYCLSLSGIIRFLLAPQINKEIIKIRNERKELNES